MKLSVPNCTSRQGRVSSLTTTKEADEDFYDPKYPIIKKAATRSYQFFDRVAQKTKKQKMLMNLVYTVNQGAVGIFLKAMWDTTLVETIECDHVVLKVGECL